MAGMREICLHGGGGSTDTVLSWGGFLVRRCGDGACGRGGCSQGAELRAGAGWRGDGCATRGFGEGRMRAEGCQEVGKERPVGGHRCKVDGQDDV